MLMLLLAPGYLFFIFTTDRKIIFQKNVFLKSLGLFLLGLLLYLYLPLVARTGPLMNWGDPSNWERFWSHLLRQRAHTLELTTIVPFSVKLLFIKHFLKELLLQFTPYLIPFGLVGLVSLRKRKKLLFTTLIMFLMNTFVLIFILHFSFEKENQNRVEEYYLPAYALFALWMGLGMATLTKYLKKFIPLSWQKLTSGALLLIFLTLPLFPLKAHYDKNDQSEFYLAYDFNASILNTLEPHAIIYSSGDYTAFPLAYLTMVENQRPDVLLGDIYGTPHQALIAEYRKLGGDPKVTSFLLIQPYIIRHSSRPIYYCGKSDTFIPPGYFLEPEGLLYRVRQAGEKSLPKNYWANYSIRNLYDKKVLKEDMARSIIFDYHHFQGQYFFQKEEIAQGITSFEKAAEVTRQNKEALNNLGNAYAEWKLFTQAEKKYRAALTLYPAYLTSRVNLVKVYQEQGEQDKALQECQEILKYDSNHPFARAQLEILTSSPSSGKDRISQQKQLIAEEPDNPILYNNLGNMYAERGRYSEAVSAYEKALSLDPTYATPHKNLALLYEENLYDQVRASHHQKLYETLKSPIPSVLSR